MVPREQDAIPWALSAVLCFASVDRCTASSSAGEAGSYSKVLAQCCAAYALDYSVPPRTDAVSTWGEKLVAAGYWSAEMSGVNSDGIPLDPWRQTYQLILVPDSHTPIVRSFGANGINDLGLLDDISSDREINPGYYWKRYWPLIDVLNLCFGLGLVVFTVAALASPRHWRVLCMWLVLAYLGVWMITVSEVMFRSLGGFRIRTVYHRLYLVGWLALAACAARTFAWGVWRFSARLVKQRRVAAGECEQCGYSLHGLDGRVCPECGERPSVDPVGEGSVEGRGRGVKRSDR